MLEYKELEEFPNYRFGNDGTVWSHKTSDGSWYKLDGRIMKYTGYREYFLTHLDGVKRFRRCHTLILLAFSVPKPEKFVGYHLNKNRDDNRLENLCWRSLKDIDRTKREKNIIKKEVSKNCHQCGSEFLFKTKAKLCKKCAGHNSYVKHKEKIKIKCKIYRSKNPQKRKKYSEIRKKNPFYKVKNQIREGLRSGLAKIKRSKRGIKTLEFLGFSREALILKRDSYLNKPCCDGRFCGGLTIITIENGTCDHIKPLAMVNSLQDVWEFNQLENLRWICASCNISKGKTCLENRGDDTYN